MQFVVVTPEALRELINESVKEAVSKALESLDRTPVEIIDTKELEKRLNITVPTIIRWKQKGKIPFIQIGSSIRFDWHKVLAALEVSNKRK